MAYSPTNWKNGDTVTADKLNKLENGVASAGGALVVGASLDEDTAHYVCNKVASEMWASFIGGKNVIIVIDGEVAWAVLSAFLVPTQGYYFFVWNGDSPLVFAAATDADYPSAEVD